MAKGKSHLERTISYLIEHEGHDRAHIAKVEQYIQGRGAHHGFKRDMFGWCDLVLLDKQQHRTVGIQVCGSDWSPHVKKLRGERAARCLDWLDVGNAIELWGWRKLKNRWTPRIELIEEAWVLNGRTRNDVFNPPVVEDVKVEGAIVAPPLEEQVLVEW